MSEEIENNSDSRQDKKKIEASGKPAPLPLVIQKFLSDSAPLPPQRPEDEDVFNMWSNFPEIETTLGELYQENFNKICREMTNERIRQSKKKLGTADTAKAAVCAVLELCAENITMKKLRERDLERIAEMVGRQKKIMASLEKLLGSVQSFNINSEKK